MYSYVCTAWFLFFLCAHGCYVFKWASGKRLYLTYSISMPVSSHGDAFHSNPLKSYKVGGKKKAQFGFFCQPCDGIYNHLFVILECKETAGKIMSAFLHPEVCESRHGRKKNKEAKTVRGAWDDGKKTKGYKEMNWTWHETRWQEGSAKEAGKERGTSKEWILIKRVFSFPGVRLSERLGGICCPTFPLWPYIKPRGK